VKNWHPDVLKSMLKKISAYLIHGIKSIYIYVFIPPLNIHDFATSLSSCQRHSPFSDFGQTTNLLVCSVKARPVGG
jgi:hypothetical protein